MQVVEPLLLWGTLTVLVPIAIHFWHQKRGKPLPWAATQWLTERDQQQSRGLRLDNVLLLLVRCLLLLLLVTLLSQLILNGLTKQETIQRIHLVQPNSLIADNFRFEIDDAIKKGEKAYWIDQLPEPIDGDKPAPTATRFTPLTLQTAINRLSADDTELHLYIANDPALSELPSVTVPKRFRLHATSDSSARPTAFLAVKANRRLFVNRAGKLIVSPTVDPGLTFQSNPAHSGSFRVLLDYRNPRERQTVRAALASLSDVYAIEFVIDEKPLPGQSYDLIGTDTDRIGPKANPATLYIVSGMDAGLPTANVVFTNESLSPQTSERVASGQLPEWIGQQLIRHYRLNPASVSLSQSALSARFVATTKRSSGEQPLVQNALLLLFVVLVVLERGMALTKNA